MLKSLKFQQLNGGDWLSCTSLKIRVLATLHKTHSQMSTPHTSRPAWLSDQAYANLLEDNATPAAVRTEALRRVVASPNLAVATSALTEYFASVDIPDVPAAIAAEAVLGHLYYSMGFFKHVEDSAMRHWLPRSSICCALQSHDVTAGAR